MKINANSLKIGNLITHNNELWTVIKLNHVKPGKGGAFVQTELKNVKDNRKLNDRFRSTENVDRIILDEKKCSYLFQENNNKGTLLNYLKENKTHLYFKIHSLKTNHRIKNKNLLSTYEFARKNYEDKISIKEKNNNLKKH